MPGVYHTSAEFFLCAYMLMPRNAAKAEQFLRMFEAEFRRVKTQGGFIQNEQADIWGAVPSME